MGIARTKLIFGILGARPKGDVFFKTKNNSKLIQEEYLICYNRIMEVTFVQLVPMKALNFGGYNKDTAILFNKFRQMQKDNNFNLDYDIYMGYLK